ncbi:MAG: hypothetical protein ACI38B_01650, partial [Bifidobacterium sp.]|uniref:hypothetical protein n=1 Tax=Bifidobacterium sp. TaxID=41200 RepID=UPI003EFDFF31
PVSVTSLWDIDDVRPHHVTKKQNHNLLPTLTGLSPSAQPSTDAHNRPTVGRSRDAVGRMRIGMPTAGK